MFPFAQKKPHHETSCLVSHIIASVLFFFAAVASLIGVLMAHYDLREGVFVFGTNADSLSLIAFVVCVSFFINSLKDCITRCEVCTPAGKK